MIILSPNIVLSLPPPTPPSAWPKSCAIGLMALTGANFGQQHLTLDLLSDNYSTGTLPLARVDCLCSHPYV